jgi:hypothetical protein
MGGYSHHSKSGKRNIIARFQKVKEDLEVYKPGSVLIESGMTIPLEALLPVPSRDLPEQQCENSFSDKSQSVIPIWSCSRWGLPCHACYQARGALLPHHFTLTDENQGRYIFCGTFPKVTLAGRITRHLVFVEPGLSSSND